MTFLYSDSENSFHRYCYTHVLIARNNRIGKVISPRVAVCFKSFQFFQIYFFIRHGVAKKMFFRRESAVQKYPISGGGKKVNFVKLLSRLHARGISRASARV